MTDFETIRKTVRAVIDETDLTTPEEIAAKVAESVPARQLRAVLAEVLQEYVRSELGRQERRSSLAMGHVPSAKRAAIVTYAQAWLRQRVVVAGEWKTTGDCTREDCIALADERQRHAEQNAAAAALWRARADLLRRHRVERLGELPVDALADVQGDAA